MNWSGLNKRGAGPAPLLFLLFLLAAVLLPGSTAHAQDGGIAMSGTFYAQVFELPPGVEVSGPAIYVVVYNQGGEESRFKMSSESPSGVEILFSESEFTLAPGGQKMVFITVKVSQEAVPGQYQLVAKVTKVAAAIEGQVVLAVAAAQQADLTIVGESATVNVQVVSPSGEPVVSAVSLVKIVGGKEMQFGYSETGVLEARVSPGSFKASAYVGGEKLAEQSFEVAAGETKNIILSGNTVYIGGFGAVPNYSNETGKLVFANIVYTINNFYQPMPNVEVILFVSLDGEPLEKISLVTFESLNTSRTGGSYNYIPSKGWESGEYSFYLELTTNGVLYTKTLEVKLIVESPASIMGKDFILLLFIGILLVLLIGLLINFILWRIWKRRHTKTVRYPKSGK